MSKRITAPVLLDRPHSLQAPPAGLDEPTRRALDAAVADAYARGVADGHREAQTQAPLDHARARDAVCAALAEATSAMSAVRQAQADAVVDLALAVAEAVIGREPHDGGRALLERVRGAVGMLDDSPLTVRANPADLEILSAGLAELDLQVLPDPALEQGEARVIGKFAQADVTQASAWDAVREVLRDAV